MILPVIFVSIAYEIFEDHFLIFFADFMNDSNVSLEPVLSDLGNVGKRYEIFIVSKQIKYEKKIIGQFDIIPVTEKKIEIRSAALNIHRVSQVGSFFNAFYLMLKEKGWYVRHTPGNLQLTDRRSIEIFDQAVLNIMKKHEVIESFIPVVTTDPEFENKMAETWERWVEDDVNDEGNIFDGKLVDTFRSEIRVPKEELPQEQLAAYYADLDEQLPPISEVKSILVIENRETFRKGGPTVKTQIRAETVKRLKDQHPEWTMVKVAMEASKELGEALDENTIRHIYRVFDWDWKRGNRNR